MATITEDYVSFETAKLLKEKRFDGECSIYYDVEDRELDEPNRHELAYDYNNIYIKAPTLQMAMKWLREKHKLFIQVNIVPHTTITMEQKYYLFSIHKDRRRLHRDDVPINYYNTYEEACEAAIKYCLKNLI